MDASPRDTLALIGGFLKPRETSAQGTNHAQYLISGALAAVGGYREVHVYQENSARLLARGALTLPAQPPIRVLEKAVLSTSRHPYAVIYACNGEQLDSAPHVLRPPHDWAPVICSVGTAHHAGQWGHALIALASGALRPTDGLIFKSRAIERIFREISADWVQRLGLPALCPDATEVIPNGADLRTNQRSLPLRQETRRQLLLADGDVVFLSLSRLNRGTKGDQQALIARWRDVRARLPAAVLVLAGAAVEPSFVTELRNTARAAGVSDRVLVLDDPLVISSRQRLMSAADVFVHLTTGVEEGSPNVVCEAMAHALPVIATRWAGLPEMIDDGENGYLIDTRAVPMADPFRRTQFGYNDVLHAAQAGQSVACRFDVFIDRAVALGDEGHRNRLAAAARRSAEVHDLMAMARRHVDFFQRVSREAARAWPLEDRFRPLVDVDRILCAQASGALLPDDGVRLADADRALPLMAGFHGEEAPLVSLVVGTLADAGALSLGELCTRVYRAMKVDEEHDSGAVRQLGRLLVRLLNHGVLALEDAVPTNGGAGRGGQV